jgi:hypothetical protein
MNRQKFAHSRVYGEFDNGSTLGIWSIQCAAADMAIHINKAPVKIWLGGSNTKHLIDAETPDWIIGRK